MYSPVMLIYIHVHSRSHLNTVKVRRPFAHPHDLAVRPPLDINRHVLWNEHLYSGDPHARLSRQPPAADLSTRSLHSVRILNLCFGWSRNWQSASPRSRHVTYLSESCGLAFRLNIKAKATDSELSFLFYLMNTLPLSSLFRSPI